MPASIKDAVGEQCPNKPADTAIVQAMLVIITDDKNKPYLNSYDGEYGKHTHDALVNFQNDKVFLRRAGYVDAGAGLAAATAMPDAKKGMVKPGDATFQKLVALLPDDRKELCAIDGAKTVYLAGEESEMQNNRSSMRGQGDLVAAFRQKVADLFEQMYKQHKIVLSLCSQKPPATRRTFQQQYDALFQVDENGNPVTHAGPGESNHNFGQAVDIGFNRLRWLKADATVVENEDWWLHKLKKERHGEARMLSFVNAMRAVATDAGLYRGPQDDYPHIQAWADSHIDMASRLAILMSLVGKMKWTGRFQRYKCDFGAGGDFYSVGTAKQIWEKNGTVSRADLAKAQSAILWKAASKAGPDAIKKFKPLTAGDIKAEDVKNMQQALRADFDLAEANWDKWTPL